MQFSDNQIGITWYSPSLDGYFRLGMVHMHSDLLKHDDNFHDDLNIGEEMKIEYYEWNIIQIRKMSCFLPQKQDIFCWEYMKMNVNHYWWYYLFFISIFIFTCIWINKRFYILIAIKNASTYLTIG